MVASGRRSVRLHLHPMVRAEVDADGTGGSLLVADRRVQWQVRGGAPARVVPSSYHSHFGVTEPTLCLEVPLAGQVLETRLGW